MADFEVYLFLWSIPAHEFCLWLAKLVDLGQMAVAASHFRPSYAAGAGPGSSSVHRPAAGAFLGAPGRSEGIKGQRGRQQRRDRDMRDRTHPSPQALTTLGHSIQRRSTLNTLRASQLMAGRTRTSQGHSNPRTYFGTERESYGGIDGLQKRGDMKKA